jgi:transcriptional regulator with XRE-family HTH domain
LLCFGVSAKRYVLFNLGRDGHLTIRKASAHGLGHLLAPYSEDDAPSQIPAPRLPLGKIGVERWQHDLWYQIIVAALEGHPDQVDLNYHPALDQPAASRYAATTPQLLRWFKTYNEKKAYCDQIRPFGFLLAFQAIPAALAQVETFDLDDTSEQKRQRKLINRLKPIAPYNRDIREAATNCFDRETGKPIDPSPLKTYRMALAPYNISPEPKVLNGEPYDRGQTCRRHVEVLAVNCMGKEANKWEEQHYLGLDQNAEIDYGMSHSDLTQLQSVIERLTVSLSQRELARRCGISRVTLSKLIRGKPVRDAAGIIQRVTAVIKQAERDEQEECWRSTTRPKDQWLDRTGGFSAFETEQQMRERVAEIERLERLMVSGTLGGDEIERVHRRICELKGIDFDEYDPPDD